MRTLTAYDAESLCPLLCPPLDQLKYAHVAERRPGVPETQQFADLCSLLLHPANLLILGE
jgi:hypothetical protein